MPEIAQCDTSAYPTERTGTLPTQPSLRRPADACPNVAPSPRRFAKCIAGNHWGKLRHGGFASWQRIRSNRKERPGAYCAYYLRTETRLRPGPDTDNLGHVARCPTTIVDSLR